MIKRYIFLTILVIVMQTMLFAQIAWCENVPLIIDVTPVSIDIPEFIFPDYLNPQATVKNIGSGTVSFDVTCTIEPGAYLSTEMVSDLAPDESVQVTFSPAFSFVGGYYVVTVNTELAGDECPENDTLVKIIYIYNGIAEENVGVPEKFMFQVSTINRGKMDIEFALAEPTTIELVIYDVLGCLSKKLISDRFPAGQYHIRSHIDLCPGVYFCHLKTGSDQNIVKKFLFIE